jgi:hypothetical protein
LNYPGIGLILAGVICWILGGYIIGAPLVLIGQILVIVGVVILLLALVKGRL